MRISTRDLLSSGWHEIYIPGKQFWSHPVYCRNLVLFREAVRVEKIFRLAAKLHKANESKGGGK